MLYIGSEGPREIPPPLSLSLSLSLIEKNNPDNTNPESRGLDIWRTFLFLSSNDAFAFILSQFYCPYLGNNYCTFRFRYFQQSHGDVLIISYVSVACNLLEKK